MTSLTYIIKNIGQISVQRVALCVQEYKFKITEGVNAFLEEAIVRRELSDNYCFYCEHYDSLKGAASWAQKSLDEHRYHSLIGRFRTLRHR